MTNLITHHFAIVLPLYFATLWMGVTSLLGLFSGWFRLSARFPDRRGVPVLRLTGQSGLMGWQVRLNGVLTIAACPTGLRVSVWRVFGPFQRPFFVPWDELVSVRGSQLNWRYAELRFGLPSVGTLRLSSSVANRLAIAAEARWPEAIVPEETAAGSRGASSPTGSC